MPVSSNSLASRMASPVVGSGNLLEVEEPIAKTAADLGRSSSAAEKRQWLARLKQALAAGNTNEASRVICRFLDSQANAPTDLGFKIGPGGFLTEAPTLRTFLLDYLGQIDPAAAAAYARGILSRPDSADEWALALRNLAAGDASAEGRALLEEKVGELLGNDAWQREPSAGFLEAFDVAVYVGSTNLATPLAGLVRKADNPAVAHAAFLALDRLVLKGPSVWLEILAAQPDLMQGRELARADFFARADIRDPRQRQILEGYLLNPRIGAAELGQFAGVFPNANYMISKNLLTATPTPDYAAVTSRDAASLQVVETWLAEPRFAPIQPELAKVRQRLEEFTRQAAGGR